ncbi:RIP metalloprotease RseP [Paracoccus sp. Z118]|uniref:RIP metalloprotease RseP n=1 Tax=Paracoccus sp. Z118 TaxID=2851017 RepID=UPI001C2C4824|nr:RIP metalloprotease RseP [Paracoccus sp. Z118]MBV0890486.1 RIP metalloprotease RseP [Paracoccus sp. Z118]
MIDIIGQMGGLAWTILAFIIALSIIVGVHEYGHYIVGRWSGIRAEVFSLGFGPRLWSRRDRRGTVWQVAAIPLGGYVRFFGDSDAASAGPGVEVDPALKRQTLEGAPLWARIATVAAGPVFNFILATLIFAGVIAWQGVAVDRMLIGEIAPSPAEVVNELRPGDEILAVEGQPVATWGELFALTATLPAAPVQDWTVRRDGAEITVPGPDPAPARISGVAPRSAAATAGLRAGDVIVAIEGAPVSRFTELRSHVEAAEGEPLLLRVWREGAGEADYTLVPRRQDLPTEDGYEQRWLIGVTGGEGYFTPATRGAGIVESVGAGARQTWAIIVGSLTGLWAVISGQIGGCNLGGAISIAESTGHAASSGAGNFIWWIGVLSAAIGFLNILPIPVLDGGHLAFFTWEAVTGRPPSDRAMRVLTSIGLAAILTLMVFGLSNDILCR